MNTGARRHHSSRALPRGEARPAVFRRHPPRSLPYCVRRSTRDGALVGGRSSAGVARHLFGPRERAVRGLHPRRLAPFDAAVYVGALGLSARSLAAAPAARCLLSAVSQVTGRRSDLAEVGDAVRDCGGGSCSARQESHTGQRRSSVTLKRCRGAATAPLSRAFGYNWAAASPRRALTRARGWLAR